MMSSGYERNTGPPPRREPGPGRFPFDPSAFPRSQQEQAILLLRQGHSLREIATVLGVSHESIRWLAMRGDIPLASNGAKLTPEQQREVVSLLRSDVPFREVARRFDVSHESIRRLALREQVELTPRGEKLTPTERRLAREQLQEARNLVDAGVSIRQVARQLGVSRQALSSLLKSKR